jgi:glycosyltransferase involved in cell wall biosynthesis
VDEKISMPPEIRVIIPAYNEQDSIAKVIAEIPSIVTEIIVVSNNSTDNTAKVAEKAGATVLHETQKGYGFACLLGLMHIAFTAPSTDVVVFWMEIILIIQKILLFLLNQL